MRRYLLSFAASFCSCASVLAWSAHGHRTITYLALEGLPSDMPAWLRDQSARNRIAEQSNEPDRWRGSTTPELAHENGPDHYIDIEDLTQFGLTLETVSPFRYEYLRDMAVAVAVHPENLKPYDAANDKDKSKQWPGFVLHEIAEHYNKLRISFNTYRILESLNDPARKDQLELARQNCMYEMGILSHFVGDTAQPLHTTTHHHGWIGDNPRGYTTDRGIHAYIDGTIVDYHKLTVDSLRPLMKYDIKLDAENPWNDTITYLKRSFAEVEPLYILERDKTLTREEGKKLISERLTDAGAMLSALYAGAWSSSKPTEREVQAWVRYNNFAPESLPSYTADGSPAVPTPAPATK